MKLKLKLQEIIEPMCRTALSIEYDEENNEIICS